MELEVPGRLKNWGRADKNRGQAEIMSTLFLESFDMLTYFRLHIMLQNNIDGEAVEAEEITELNKVCFCQDGFRQFGRTLRQDGMF